MVLYIILQKNLTLLEEERAFNQAVEANIADMLIAADNDGKWITVNPAFEKATGFTQADMVGIPVEEFPALPPELGPMVA